ncbi:MAG: MFS transporter [Bacteroidetes bacterium]|nr:MFS transporter [Bacteroidota bacterium]
MPEQNKFRIGPVITISIGHFLHDVYSSFLAPILPLLIDKLGMTYSMVGVLSTLQRIPSLLNPFIGVLADRVAMRYLVILAPAVTATAMSLIGVAPSITVLAILLFVMGISSALFHVPAPVMIRKVSGNKIGRGMGWFMFGGEMARTAGPVVILGAVSLWGLEGTYKLIPFGLGATLILYFAFRNIHIREDMQKRENHRGIWNTLRHHKKLFIAITGFTFFMSIMKSSMVTFLPTYLNLRGESLWMSGISLSVLEIAGAAGALFAGRLSDRIGRSISLMIIAIATPFFMLLFLFAAKAWSFLLLICIGLTMFSSTPILMALIQEHASERPAFMNSVYMTISFFISAFNVITIGFMSDILGMNTTFIFAGLLAFLAIPFTFFIRGPRAR